MKIDRPLWSIGFRPFFLFGAVAGLLLILSWALQFNSGHFVQNYYSPTVWHGHEMIFGFSVSILSGFLLTASQNWSGKRGVHGWPLLGLVVLWALGRLVPFLPQNLFWLVTLIDLSFIPALIYCLIPYLFMKGQGRNRKIVVILALLFIANLLVHFGFEQKGMYLGIDVFVLVMLLIGGRIIPFFRSKVLQVPVISPIVVVEKISIALLLLFLFSGIFDFSVLRTFASIALSFVFLFKWWRWRPLEALKVPILFVLYLAYFWIIVGFGLVGLQAYIGLPLSWAMHCFTVGGIGGLTLGMMTRVSLGHTGRPIKGTGLIVFSYTFMNLALIARLFLPWWLPAHYGVWILVAGIFWAISFLVFLIQFTPILLKPRCD